MLVTNHVLSGALIGAVARQPAVAFAAGVASHFMLDTLPHLGEWRDRKDFLRTAVPDGLAGLAIIGTFAAVAPADQRLAVLAGMAGAALPDIDKPSRIWFGRSPFPRVVDAFHSAIQHESRDRAPVEAAAAVVLSITALTLLRRQRHAAVKPA